MAAPALQAGQPLPQWVVAAARCTGESHARRGERGQDALCVRVAAGGVLVAAVADGAGSARRGGVGAALASRAMVGSACAALETVPLCALPDTAPDLWLADARRRIALAAGRHSLAPRDFAATLVMVLSDGQVTQVVHIGDGAAVALGREGWRALSWPAGGEHAGTTYFVTDTTPALRVSRHHAPVSAVALLTDGLERLVLDFTATAPHEPFFARMAAPLEQRQQPGRDAALSRALGAWLRSDGVAARTDDDRTLLLARLIA